MKKIFLIFVILIPVSMRAQTPAWPDSSGPTSAGCYRLAVHPLTEAPPLRSDMSLSTLLGYIYLDSVMRTPLSDSQWAAFEAIQSFDSLKDILKYIYALTAYDPVLLAEYNRDAPYINPGYWSKPSPVLFHMEEKIGSVLQSSGDTTQKMYLTMASYILHIKVIGVTRNWDSMGHYVSGKGTPQSCVEALILDTIKGQHILTGDCEFLHRIKSGDGKTLADTTPGDCFHFDFNPITDKSGNNPTINVLPSDSIIFAQNAMGWNGVVADSEYIVFCAARYFDYDGTYSSFDITPIMGGQGGIYPVNGGIVSDPKNNWRLGTSVAIGDFETALKATISKIQNP
ncbi:MAG TPA: hypothetical protein VGM92_02590 [Candidatus Kapabacteria bacterium]